MQPLKRSYRVVLAWEIVILGAACSTTGPSLPTPIATQNQGQTTPSGPGQIPADIITAAAPTPSFPPDWEAFYGETPKVSLYHAPGWTVSSSEYHIEFDPPSGFAWAEIDWLSPDNPGLAGEPLASGGELSQLSSQLEAALKDNGTFKEPESIGTIGGGLAWLIEGYHESYGDNIIVGLVSSGETAVQFIGHQGDPSEDWERLRDIYRQMIQSISF